MSLATPEKLRKLQRALYAKAKQEPARRFHFLYDKVWREDVLAHAFAFSRGNGGAPGVDGETFACIESYGVERWLGELGEEVRTGRYKPQPVRRVMIPKSGGVGQRPLGIPTIRDRVVQTAAKLVIEPIFEADFDEAAHGYRPRRSALDAVRKVHRAMDEGRTEVVDADLSKYFDTIPHPELMKCLARRISDGKTLHLIKMWLKVPVEEMDERGNWRMSGGKKATRGTPQGGVASPMLANIYMHRYIKAFRKNGLEQKYGAVLVNYADDFVVLCRHGAKKVLATTRRWMASIGLTLNEEKTSLRNTRCESFDFLGYTFGPMYSPRTGGRYNGAWPSKKAIASIKEAIRKRLRNGNQAPWPEVVTGLTRTLRGWQRTFATARWRRLGTMYRLICTKRSDAFFGAATRWPGLGTDSFPKPRSSGNWASSLSRTSRERGKRMPTCESRPRAG